MLKSSKQNDYSEAQINNEIKPFLEEIIKQQDIRKNICRAKEILCKKNLPDLIEIRKNE